jgi:uncharacterized damage-inducible protein DinB
MNMFPTLAKFNPWVNTHIYDAAATLSEKDYFHDCGAFFGSIHHTLNHILVVDRLWFGRAQGIKPDVKSLDQILFDDFAALRLEREAEDQRIIDFVCGLTEDDLTEVVPFHTTAGDPGKLPRGHMLMAVFNHQTHHRGQITAMLSTFDADYGDIDLPYFLNAI